MFIEEQRQHAFAARRPRPPCSGIAPPYAETGYVLNRRSWVFSFPLKGSLWGGGPPLKTDIGLSVNGCVKDLQAWWAGKVKGTKKPSLLSPPASPLALPAQEVEFCNQRSAADAPRQYPSSTKIWGYLYFRFRSEKHPFTLNKKYPHPEIDIFITFHRRPCVVPLPARIRITQQPDDYGNLEITLRARITTTAGCNQPEKKRGQSFQLQRSE